MAGQRRARCALLRLDLDRARAGVAAGLFAAGLSAAGLAASGLAASPVLVSGLASSFLAAGSSFSAPCRLRLFSLSDLKSVSYQPEPLRRNTGAEMSLRKPFFPQFGQVVSGLSEIFCSTASW